MIRKIVYSPILFFALLLSVSSCSNYTKEESKEYYLLTAKADKANKKVQLDSAYFYYNLAKDNCWDKNGEDYTYVLLQMATIQQSIGDFYGSEETITEALANYEGTVYKPYLYNMLAVAYDSQGKLDDALEYYKKAYDNFEDNTGKILAQNNIGLIYQQKNQHEKAIRLLKPLLKKYNRKEDIALILSNLGYSQFKLNHPEAYANLSQSLHLTDSLHRIDLSIPTNIHLAEFFRDSDEHKSKQYAIDALDAAKKAHKPDLRLKALEWLVEISEGIDYKQYSIGFIKLSDSLNRSRNSAKNQFAKIKFDSKKAKENEQKYKHNMWLAVGMALFILLSGATIVYYIRKRGKEKLKGSVNETETRISKKIHDELANDVYQAIAFTETQNLEQPDNKEALLDNLSNIYSKARDISQTNSEVYTDERYADSLLDLINSFSGNDTNIITKGYDNVDWDRINEHSKNALYRVIQELLVNMKKHSGAHLAMLDFESKPKVLEIRYSDNGKGIDPAKFSKKGLQYAENRIHAVKGIFTFDKNNSNGFRVTIQIPK